MIRGVRRVVSTPRNQHFSNQRHSLPPTAFLPKGAMIAPEAIMANRKASVWLYCKTSAGWRYCKPVIGKNNKPKPGWALVNSHEEHHPNASYYVRHRDGAKTVWRGARLCLWQPACASCGNPC